MTETQEETTTLKQTDTKITTVPKMKKKPLQKDHDIPFIVTVLILETIIIVLYAVTTDYNQGHPGNSYDNYTRLKSMTTDQIIEDYPPFQDIHGMVFVGFGFLMTFLRKYGFSSISFNFLLCGFGIQWGMLVWDHIGTGHIFYHHHRRIVYTTQSLVDADFAVATILISMGAVLGRASPTQLLWMAFFEIIIYSLNAYIFYYILNAYDPGGSITIHTFGAYWGLATSFILGPPKDDSENKSMYQSDMFSMIGTLFLWLYWPSFNSFYCDNTYWERDRAVLNTVLSLCACIMSAYLCSKLFRQGRFEMMHIQNSTLAGGVVMGACGGLYLQPAGAMGIGIVAGIVSVTGYCFVQPLLLKIRFRFNNTDFGWWDTCGINNLHGMPGMLGCFASAVAIGSAAHNKLYHDGSKTEVVHHYGYQLMAGRQILGLLITWALSIPGGIFCGFLIKFFPENQTWFDDQEEFEVPEGEKLDQRLRGTIRGKQMMEGIKQSEQLEQN